MNEQERRHRFMKQRALLGWNQSVTGRRLHVTSNHVNMIERGKATPSPTLLAFLETFIPRKKHNESKLDILMYELTALPEGVKDRAINICLSVAKLGAQNM